MATYRERRERKAERLREWADGREVKADAAHDAARAAVEHIPFGQPILVGHHSERGHRRDIARSHSAMDAAVENSAKAAQMRSRADNIEAQAANAIYSDDPDAIERLTDKLARLEAQRDAMKAANAEYRKANRDALKAMTPYERNNAVPHPGWSITNLGATINATRKRIASLSTPETGRTLVTRYDGECRKCGTPITKGETVLYFRRDRAIEHTNDCTEEVSA